VTPRCRSAVRAACASWVASGLRWSLLADRNAERGAGSSIVVMMDTSGSATEDVDVWTVRRLVARHKPAAIAAVALVALTLVTIAVSLVGSAAVAVSDATTCSQWGSATQDQQTAYARLYIREHGPPRGVGSQPVSVIGAINNGCMQAYANDISDNVTVAQAISGNS